MIAGIVGVFANFMFMSEYGFIVSGYSQIFSYLFMAIFLFFVGKKVSKLKIKLFRSSLLVLAILFYVGSLYFINPLVEKGNYLIFISVSIVFIIIITVIYFIQQKLNPFFVLKQIASNIFTLKKQPKL